MGEIEAWKATGQRALRIARQRGWLGWPMPPRRSAALLGGTLIAAAMISHVADHHTHSSHSSFRFVHRAESRLVDRSVGRAMGRSFGRVDVRPPVPPVAPLPPAGPVPPPVPPVPPAPAAPAAPAVAPLPPSAPAE